jgi:hypothetical protein
MRALVQRCSRVPSDSVDDDATATNVFKRLVVYKSASVDVEIGTRRRSYSSLGKCVTAKCFRFGYRRLEKRFGSCYIVARSIQTTS